MAWLIPMPAVLPLLVAAAILALGRWLPQSVGSAVSLATAVLVALAAGQLMRASTLAPLVYWFGAWQPRNGVALGIAFVVDPFGAGLAAFVASLFAASFVFAWGFFKATASLFHVLMLTFLAAMVGFCLSGDLFNMFVFFELMSVTAFALTAYKLEASSLAGAIQFTVTNSLAGFIMLWGIALLYGRTGALNLAQIHDALAGHPADALVLMAMVMLFSALMIKAAAVPFHLWLADAHAVAPTPVSVLFSGVMVTIGVFGVARLYWTIFADVVLTALVRDVLTGFGVATAIIGALACLTQRHIKRLLAFSTISHIGVVLAGCTLADPSGVAGAALYAVGHGLVKGALFMAAGVLLARLGGIDEIELRGCGGAAPGAGVLFAVGGLLLGGLPLGLAHDGKGMIDAALDQEGWSWAGPVLSACAAITGAAVLRVTGRVFLGLGPESGEESSGPSEHEREHDDRPVWIMLAPAAAMMAAAILLVLAPVLREATLHAAGSFMQGDAYAAHVLFGAPWPALAVSHAPPSSAFRGLIAVAGAIALAAMELFRDCFPTILTRAQDLVLGPLFIGLNRLHSGRVGDYVAWLMVGIVSFGAALALGGGLAL